MDLATFLISRACNNSTLANYFHWPVSRLFVVLLHSDSVLISLLVEFSLKITRSSADADKPARPI